VIVTLNNVLLNPAVDYDYLDGIVTVLIPPATGTTLVVLETDPASAGLTFRIFQDMRGVQSTYRITPQSTTTTTAAVAITDDIISVTNAEALIEPNLAANVWGVVTIGVERIMYRYRDIVNNTISGLLRGTAGTAITAHARGATVYNMGKGNLLPQQYQNYLVTNLTYPLVSGVNLGDASTTVFTATDINLTVAGSLQVYLGGILQTTGYTITATDPCEITFDQPPPAGVEVAMVVAQGVTWYAQGNGTASNGQPLQTTQTQAARFLQGY
jgi:hypothetical protein